MTNSHCIAFEDLTDLVVFSRETLYQLIHLIGTGNGSSAVFSPIKLFGEKYVTYISNVLTSNRGRRHFVFETIDEVRVDQDDVIRILADQLNEMTIDHKKCFMQVVIEAGEADEGNIRLTCSEFFYHICSEYLKQNVKLMYDNSFNSAELN